VKQTEAKNIAQKKAAANAAAKARRWIQELQINVGVHGAMSRNASTHLKSVANGEGWITCRRFALSGCFPWKPGKNKSLPAKEKQQLRTCTVTACVTVVCAQRSP